MCEKSQWALGYFYQALKDVWPCQSQEIHGLITRKILYALFSLLFPGAALVVHLLPLPAVLGFLAQIRYIMTYRLKEQSWA